MSEQDTFWEIIPDVGVGPLRFGMGRKEVAALGALPDVDSVTDEHGEYQENRGMGEPLLRYVDGKLVEIVCDEPSHHRYTFNGTWVFDPDPRQVLIDASEGLEAIGVETGYVVIGDTGVSFWNYITAIEDGAIIFWDPAKTTDRRMVIVSNFPEPETGPIDYEPTLRLRRESLVGSNHQ